MKEKMKYKTAKELKKACDKYFKSCDGKPALSEDGSPMFDKFGNQLYVDKKPKTVTGLCRALGFKSRQTLLNYKQRGADFKDVIDDAKLQIQEYAEEQLYTKDGFKGAQFVLACNFNWSSKEEAKEETTAKSGIILAEIKDE